ncbi:MAG TPA: hypothetical protein PKX93_05755, partial [bacterium]|nr:hypothetical protein [bacterium]
RGPDGTINGYGLARKGEKAMHLGPVVASSVAVAEKILDNLLCLAAGSFVFIDVIERNGAATSLVARRAFTRQRGLTRMYLGENSHPGEISGIYAISGGEKG